MENDPFLKELDDLRQCDPYEMCHKSGRLIIMRFAHSVSEAELCHWCSHILNCIRDRSIDHESRLMYAYSLGTLLWLASRLPSQVINEMGDLARDGTIPKDVRLEIVASMSHPAQKYTENEKAVAIEQLEGLKKDLVSMLPDDIREAVSRTVNRLLNPIDIERLFSQDE